MTILSPLKIVSGRAEKRSRDHAADPVFAIENSSSDIADLIKALYRYHLFVGGDLKHRIGGRIDDRLSGPDMLFAKLFDYLSARCGNISQDTRHRGVFDKTTYYLRRKSIRV